MNSILYLHLQPGQNLPQARTAARFNAVLVLEASVTPQWQAAVSKWLVSSGCRYAMAWGVDCSSWDDSIDIANIDEFPCGEIPDDGFVMTTWHPVGPLADVFEFSSSAARHPTLEVHDVLLLHISDRSREDELLKSYRAVIRAREQSSGEPQA